MTGDQVWREYRRAVGRVGELRRAGAAAAAEQVTAARAAGAELAEVRARLALQQARLAEAAARSGVTDPGLLLPGPEEFTAAAAEVGDAPAAVLHALRQARRAVDEADAALLDVGTPAGPAGWPPRLRNLLVYVPIMLFLLVGQLVLLSGANEASLPLYAPVCGLVLPAMAFGVGYLLIGLIFPAPAGSRVDRTPLLGATLCLVSVAMLLASVLV